MADDDLSAELEVVRLLVVRVRERLYRVESGRATAVALVAAVAAEQAGRALVDLPAWRNSTSDQWQVHLRVLWRYLEGDQSQFRALSAAVADYLVSPLNHNAGQDGPDDFDRPQILASYAAVLAGITGVVGFAELAVEQVFEALDLRYDGESGGAGRQAHVARAIHGIDRALDAISRAPGRLGTNDLTRQLRHDG